MTLTAIYAYRFYKNIKEHDSKNRIKNLVLFGIFSICSCYTHYYALITAGVINLIELIYLVKLRKEEEKALKHFIILAVIQVILYLPWLIYLITQFIQVNNGYWISINWIGTLLGVITSVFCEGENGKFAINIKNIVVLITSCLIYGYLIFKIVKNKKDMKLAGLSLGIYACVIAIVSIISIKTPILYPRYLTVITGLYVFAISYVLSKEDNKIITSSICLIILVLGISYNIQKIKDNYDKSNDDLYEYLEQNLKENDVIASINIDVTALTSLRFPNYKHYFLTPEYRKGLEAFCPEMIICDDYQFLKDVKGRVWIILEGKGENTEDEKLIRTKYFGYTYYIKLLDG